MRRCETARRSSVRSAWSRPIRGWPRLGSRNATAPVPGGTSGGGAVQRRAWCRRSRLCAPPPRRVHLTRRISRSRSGFYGEEKDFPAVDQAGGERCISRTRSSTSRSGRPQPAALLALRHQERLPDRVVQTPRRLAWLLPALALLAAARGASTTHGMGVDYPQLLRCAGLRGRAGVT